MENIVKITGKSVVEANDVEIEKEKSAFDWREMLFCYLETKLLF